MPIRALVLFFCHAIPAIQVNQVTSLRNSDPLLQPTTNLFSSFGPSAINSCCKCSTAGLGAPGSCAHALCMARKHRALQKCWLVQARNCKNFSTMQRQRGQTSWRLVISVVVQNLHVVGSAQCHANPLAAEHTNSGPQNLASNCLQLSPVSRYGWPSAVCRPQSQTNHFR